MAEHVLHILGSAQPESTGMAHIVRALAQGLDPERYLIHTLFLSGAGPLVDSLQQDGSPADALDWQRGMRDPVGCWKFWHFLRRRHFSIVHIHFGGRSIVSLVRAATNARIIRHLHGRILEGQGLTPIFFSVRGADAVIAVSQAVASRVVDGKARVIYAGVSIPAMEYPRPQSNSEVVIGTAGRLVELKGIGYLLRAAAILQQEFPALRVEIAGSGPDREKLGVCLSKAEILAKLG